MNKFIFLSFCVFSLSAPASSCLSSFDGKKPVHHSFNKQNPVYRFIYHNDLKSKNDSLDPNINFRDIKAQDFMDFFTSTHVNIQEEFQKIKNDEYKRLGDINDGIFKLYTRFLRGEEFYDFLLRIFPANSFVGKSKSSYTKQSSRQIFSVIKNINESIINEKVVKKLSLIYEESSQTEQKKEMSEGDGLFMESMIYQDFTPYLDSKPDDLQKKLHAAINNMPSQFDKGFYIKDKEFLLGLKKKQINAAAKKGSRNKKDGSYYIDAVEEEIEILSYAHNRDFRKKVYEYLHQDSSKKLESIKKILHVKEEIAKQSRFKNYANYHWRGDSPPLVKSADNAAAFLKQLIGDLKDLAEKEMDDLALTAKKIHGVESFEPWDIYYYKTIQDKNILKINLFLPHVMEMVFKHFETMFKIKFEENSTFPVYRSNVKSYNVYYSGEHVGISIFDLYNPSHSSNKLVFGDNSNISPTYKDPSSFSITHLNTYFKTDKKYLNFENIMTIFHEMGHLVEHYIGHPMHYFGKSTDRAEFYSMLQEAFFLTDEVFDLITENDPQVRLSAKGFFNQRYDVPLAVSFLKDAYTQLLNISLHSANEIKDLKEFERNLIAELNLSPFLEKFLLSRNAIVNILSFDSEDSNENGSPDSLSESLDDYSYLYSHALGVYFLNQYAPESKSIYNLELRKKLISLYKKQTIEIKDLKQSGKGTVRNKELVRSFINHYFR